MRTSKSSSLAEAKLNKPGTPLSSVIIIDFGRWRRCGSRLEIGTPLARFLSSRPAQPAQPTHEVIHTGGATHPPPTSTRESAIGLSEPTCRTWCHLSTHLIGIRNQAHFYSGCFG